MIAKIARVSNSSNQENPDYVGLIRYLIKNKHWSPFEMVSACFEIRTSRAISAQIIRHRSFSYQEFSQRYAEVIDVEPIEIRRQAKTNRQSSEEIFDPVVAYFHDEMTASDAIDLCLYNTGFLYCRLIEAGVAKECARMIMPLASSTTIYMTGTLRSWIHYLSLRNDEHAQKEHREIAIEIENELREHFPVVFEALDSIKQEGQNKELVYKMLQVHKRHQILSDYRNDDDLEFLKGLLNIIN